MFRKVLIANRGEIACRIAGTLREMGLRAVAVCSEADVDALHVRTADEVQLLGPAEPRASYLNTEAILAAARASDAQAIHPGYGFLAENADFAAAVEAAGMVFLGPTAEQIRTMGDKRAARAIARRLGVPVVPGAEGEDPGALAAAGRKIGYPLLLKAALGGGGKGMRVVASEAELRDAFESTRRVALSGFGDGAVYVEKRLERARHVEVQVAGDGAGAVIHLFERECSLQRRHQKVVEESPSPALGERLRTRMLNAAMDVAREVRYRGVGTVEFLVAGEEFWFLEMNTRLQVEHPVTELTTGIDLVRLQLEIAAQNELPFGGSEIVRHGHAIEARVYAEDAAAGFLPQAGVATRVRWPRGPFIRVDAGIESGDAVPVHYDPILAKVIAVAPDRSLALARLARALDDALVHGVTTNLPFLRALVRAPEVEQARADTEWIEREFMAVFSAMAGAPAPELALVAAALTDGDGAHRRHAPAGHETAGEAPFRAVGPWRLPGLD
ncbi:MAG TPA: biotin carboxylase N-terminal domain-containing protein [Candidatus Eisenbacteria bacterium]|nr:biotin carboxylase N-terminal domain-containing protein [Candidatus Eisenbacteria bacterium]